MAQFKAYIGSQDQGTAQFMQILGRMPPQDRTKVQIVPVQPDGPEPPHYVRGVPTLVSTEQVPRVWEGAAAIELIGSLQGGGDRSDATPSQSAPLSAPTGPRPSGRGARGAAAFIDSLDGASSAPPLDNRQSYMSSSGGGKITQSEIDAYTQARNQTMPMPPITR